MKKLLLIFFLITVFLGAKEKPIVCLNMIVKNESKVIRRCLESVKPLIDTWVIVDTGSTDGTQKIIKEFMKDIPGELYERPWVNFAHNRNEALALAKGKSEYVLFIDADDILTFTPNFVRPKLDKESYSIQIQYSDLLYSRPQLVKNELDWKWGGVVHEALVSPRLVTSDLLEGVTMVIVGGGDRSHDPKKFHRDALLLEKALLEEPNNARNVFYLAQSYADAEMPELAIKNYEKRVAMGGWDQEVFWALYQIGRLQERLKMSEEAICKSYYKAFNYRPTRAEPLYRLSNYYRLNENYLLGYLVANFALSIKPSSDALFIESWIYDYGLLLEYSICAYWIGRYEESFDACTKLLSNSKLPPNVRECAGKNLTFAISKLSPEELKKKAS